MRDKELEKLRQKLITVDEKIVSLINERAKIACKIGEAKKNMGKEIYDPVQEAKVYERLINFNQGPLKAETLRTIFREIISASRSLQTNTWVAFLGPDGSFSHLAALHHFGNSIECMPVDTVGEVFTAVEKGQAHWGVVPLENSVEGPVKPTLDHLITTPLTIRAETFIRISHSLFSQHGELQKIKRIYSHPQALAQCQQWLKRNLPFAEWHEVKSTAEAAGIAQNDSEAGAVCSTLAAELRGLKTVAKGIEDHPLNTTRFLVIGYGMNEPSGKDKTSLLFGTPHIPGSLYRALEPFARMGINLTRIASYPIRDRLWEYLFFVDFLGHHAIEPIKTCLEEAKERTSFIKNLGSYPVGEEA